MKDEPAFPGDEVTIDVDGHPYTHPGLTKRELFAAMAMQGLMANSDQRHTEMSYGLTAENAVQMANALIAELSKEGKE